MQKTQCDYITRFRSYFWLNIRNGFIIETKTVEKSVVLVVEYNRNISKLPTGATIFAPIA